jgi:hypothetical protein
MSDIRDPDSGSLLLREHCLQRLMAVNQEIDRIHVAGLLLRDAEIALDELRRQCQKQILSVSMAPSDEVLRIACSASLEKLRSVLVPLLGMILRSSNLRLAFELYYPLKRLTAMLYGRSLKDSPALLLSSDWKYYPDTHVGQTLDIVILGFPAVESSNAMIVPLAGHELGHNVWHDNNQQHAFDSRVSTKLRNVISEQFWSQLLAQELGTVNPQLSKRAMQDDVQVNGLITDLTKVVLGQLEEYFCDAVGLRLFSEAYLRSLCYSCLPGYPPQGIAYPQLRDRIDRLETLAAQIDVQWCVDQSQCYRYVRSPDAKSSVVGQVVDTFIAEVQLTALNILDERQAPRRDVNNVDRIARQFRSLVPAAEKEHLTDLINAAWLVSHDQNTAHSYGLEMSRWREVVNQITLKSCEVSEYHERVNQDVDAKGYR